MPTTRNDHPATSSPRRFRQLQNLSVPDNFDDPSPDAEIAAWLTGSTMTFLSVTGSSVIQPEHRGQAAAIRAFMLRDRSSGNSTGRGDGVGRRLNSPVCVIISDVHRFVPATTSYVSALAVARLCAQTAQNAIYDSCALCSRVDAGTLAGKHQHCA